jgi:sec-independent protein translocase protein TatA
MGIGSIGFSEMVVIFIIILIFFGPRRFPEIARSLGHAMREFRRSLNQIQRELEEADPRSAMPGRDWGLSGSGARERKSAAQPGGREEARPGNREEVLPPEIGEAGDGTSPAEQLPMFGQPTEDAGAGPSDGAAESTGTAAERYRPSGLKGPDIGSA